MASQLRMVVRRNISIAESRVPVRDCTLLSIANGSITWALATAVALPLDACPAGPVAKASDPSAGNMPMIIKLKMGKVAMLE